VRFRQERFEVIGLLCFTNVKSHFRSKTIKTERSFKIWNGFRSYFFPSFFINIFIRGHSNNMWHSKGVGVRDSVTKREGGQPKCHVSFFCFLKLNFTAKVFKSYGYCKIKIVTSHRGRGGPSHCHQMTQGGVGSKIGQKVSHIIWMAL